MKPSPNYRARLFLALGDFVEYETRLNYVLSKYDDAVCRTYDLARFAARTAMDIMRTHPVVIVGDMLRENHAGNLRNLAATLEPFFERARRILNQL